MGGNKYSIEWGGNHTELAPGGAGLAVECYVSASTNWGKKAIGYQAEMLLGDSSKFISYISYTMTDGTFEVKFVTGPTTYLGPTTYSAKFVYIMDGTARATLSAPSRMTNTSTYTTYSRSLITINPVEDVTFSYDIEVYNFNSERRGVILHGARVSGSYENEFRYHVVASPIPSPGGFTSPGDPSCPRLVAFSHTDVLGGGNMREGIFRYTDANSFNEWKEPINITPYVLPDTCGTLIDKIYVNGARLDDLMEYSTLRYFLWFLVTGEWCLSSLLRRNTDVFFSTLSSSSLACWVQYFDKPSIRGYDRYFMY